MSKDLKNIEAIMEMIRKLAPEETIRAALASAILGAHQAGYRAGYIDCIEDAKKGERRDEKFIGQ